VKLVTWFAAAISVMLMAACSATKRGEPAVGPMRMSDASIKAGEKLYNMHCYKCHTMGAGGLGPSLNDKPLPRFLIRLQIRHGLGVMPAFSEQQLSDQQVEEIIDYVIAMRHHDIET
jgi:mono/diheme cytochrome c family protein